MAWNSLKTPFVNIVTRFDSKKTKNVLNSSWLFYRISRVLNLRDVDIIYSDKHFDFANRFISPFSQEESSLSMYLDQEIDYYSDSLAMVQTCRCTW